MCGIIAFTSTSTPVVGHLLEGLTILQNRGYDSAGIATVTADGIVITKYASVNTPEDSIGRVKAAAPARHAGHTCGIAHTRWATHGGLSDANSHPFVDWRGRLALVHNGTIENCDELRAALLAQGVTFTSETDSEVIVNLISSLKDAGSLSTVEAVQAAVKQLTGTWGLVILDRDAPGTLIAVRNGSPLVVGLSDGGTFVASEAAAFTAHTSDIVYLTDGEMAVLHADGHSLERSRIVRAPANTGLTSPEPYTYWMEREIHEQPAAVHRALGMGSRCAPDGRVRLGGLDLHAAALLPVRDLLLSACGTSLYAASYGAKLMRWLGAFATVQVEDAAEVGPDALPPRASGGLCVVSQSGETKDTHRALTTALDAGLPVFSVVNTVGSLIARTTDCGVYLNAGREVAVASTKAFTTQVVALALIACWFAQHRATAVTDAAAAAGTATAGACATDAAPSERQRELVSALLALPGALSASLQDAALGTEIEALARRVCGRGTMFVLGKGAAESVAKEAALKIKEVSGVHAEGFSGGALKHGPFALISKDTPVVLLLLGDEHWDKMRTATHEVKARGAYTIVVTDRPHDVSTDLADVVLPVPSNGPLTALVAVAPLQLLAFHMAVAAKLNPDFPRNLAKAVTVD